MSESRYTELGVDIPKKGLEIFKASIQSIYPRAFCAIKQDPEFPDYALIPHADGAGSKPILSYIDFKETGEVESFKGIAQDVVAMNLDDIVCVGAKPISFLDYVAINKTRVPKEELLRILNSEILELKEILRGYSITLPFDGGETADLPDQISTLDVSGFMQGRVALSRAITGEKIRPGNKIIGIASGGQARYEKKANSGIMCNGITLARHCLLSNEYEKKYPEIRGSSPKGYYGRFMVEDYIDELGMTIGEALTSPTRLFAPIVIRILDELGSSITGLVHNTGGGQTKCLKLGKGLRYIKNNLIEPDPIFMLIQRESKESWRDMFQDYNMGVGFEMILEEDAVEPALSIIESFGVKAKLIGKIEASSDRNQVLIESGFGKFAYNEA